MLRRYLARQFARPRGRVGRWLIAPWLDRINQGMNALAFELLAPRSGDRVLEVGFGGGALMARILTRGAEVVGADISEEAVARARSRFREEILEGRAQVLGGSAESLPLGDAAVDAACSLNCIYFWKEPGQAMREFARVLRPRGKLVIGLEAPETLRAWPGHRFGFTVYEAHDVVRLAEAAGFGNARVHEGLEPKFGKIYCVECERL